MNALAPASVDTTAKVPPIFESEPVQSILPSPVIPTTAVSTFEEQGVRDKERQNQADPKKSYRETIDFFGGFFDDIKTGARKFGDVIGNFFQSNPGAIASVDNLTPDQTAAALNNMPGNVTEDDRVFKGRTFANIFNLENLFNQMGPDAARQRIDTVANPFDRAVARAYVDTYYNNNFDRNSAAQAALKTAEEARLLQIQELNKRQAIEDSIRQQDQLTDRYRGEAIERAIKKITSENGGGRVGRRAADGGIVPASAQDITALRSSLDNALTSGDITGLRAQLVANQMDSLIPYIEQAQTYFNNKQAMIDRMTSGATLKGTPQPGEMFVYNYTDAKGTPQRRFIQQFLNPATGTNTLVDVATNRPLTPQERNEIGPKMERVQQDTTAKFLGSLQGETGKITAIVGMAPQTAAAGALTAVAKEQGEKLPEITQKLDKIQTAKSLLSQGTNYGPALSTFAGRGPIARGLGTQLETEAQNRTKAVQSTITAIINFKVIPGAISEKEFVWLKENQPQLSDSPDSVRQWLERAERALASELYMAQRYSGIGSGAAGTAAPGTSPTAPTAPAAPGSRPARGTAANPIKLD